MKIRNGFVSNSSSSSFCVIGVSRGWRDRDGKSDKNIIDLLAEAEGKDFGEYTKRGNWDSGTDYFSQGVNEGNVVTFYGDDIPHVAGIDAELMLLNYTIPQACEEFQRVVKEKLGVAVPIEKIGFHYGEAGNG